MRPKPLKKTAVALPEDLLARIDEAAKAESESRNRFIIAALERDLRARRGDEIRKSIETVFSDPKEAESYLREVREWDAASADWPDEGW